MSNKLYLPHKEKNGWVVDFPNRDSETGDITYIATEYVWEGLIYEYNCDGEIHHEHSFNAVLESITMACLNGHDVDINGYGSQYSNQEKNLINKLIDKISQELSQYNIPETIKKIKEETVKPVFKISFEDTKPIFYKSKIGGNPFWKKDMKYPMCDGKPMLLLAQVNLKELPSNNMFPPNGMLQFFIAQDGMYGYGRDKARVVFHKDLSNGMEYKLKIDSKNTPIRKEGRMKFEMSEECISLADINFEKYKLSFPKELDDFVDDIFSNRLCWGEGSKLLGYPYFTQYAPSALTEYDTLLFQLDSDFDFIMYGDVGVGNFFIKSKDLEEMKFDDVFYTWDCC